MFDIIEMAPRREIAKEEIDTLAGILRKGTPFKLITDLCFSPHSWQEKDAYVHELPSCHGMGKLGGKQTVLTLHAAGADAHIPGQRLVIDMTVDPEMYVGYPRRGDGWDKLTAIDGVRDHVKFVALFCSATLEMLQDCPVSRLVLPTAFPDRELAEENTHAPFFLSDLLRVTEKMLTVLEGDDNYKHVMMLAAELDLGFRGDPSAFMERLPGALRKALADPKSEAALMLPEATPCG
ncbi:MAG TPA: hypothetical protein VLA04_05710 [Verrucomicrobiae bacterium]|nr:hypothetical protein [Verrucomicrobiae bacterium]